MKERLLFVCTANINRSRTAEEDLPWNHDRYEVKSAGIGIHSSGKRIVTQELIDWANIIFVMDEKMDRHKTILQTSFDLKGKEVVVLGIPDLYRKGEKLLIATLIAELESRGVMFRGSNVK